MCLLIGASRLLEGVVSGHHSIPITGVVTAARTCRHFGSDGSSQILRRTLPPDNRCGAGAKSTRVRHANGFVSQSIRNTVQLRGMASKDTGGEFVTSCIR